MRVSQRADTVGAPPRFAARDSTACGAAHVDSRKSAATRPMRASGSGSPNAMRMGRLIHGPGSVASGHTVSSSAPSTTLSKASSRASRRPSISTRGCGPPSRPRLPRNEGAAAPAMAESNSAGHAAGAIGPSDAIAGASAARWEASASPSGPA